MITHDALPGRAVYVFGILWLYSAYAQVVCGGWLAGAPCVFAFLLWKGACGSLRWLVDHILQLCWGAPLQTGWIQSLLIMNCCPLLWESYFVTVFKLEDSCVLDLCSLQGKSIWNGGCYLNPALRWCPVWCQEMPLPCLSCLQCITACGPLGGIVIKLEFGVGFFHVWKADSIIGSIHDLARKNPCPEEI